MFPSAGAEGVAQGEVLGGDPLGGFEVARRALDQELDFGARTDVEEPCAETEG